MIKVVKINMRKRLGDLSLWFRARKVSRAQHSLIILMYHAVTESFVGPDSEQVVVPKKLFRRQMGWLKELNYPVMSLREGVKLLRNGPLPFPIVSLTFDDGYFNTYTDAFPILSEYGYPATVFLVPEAMKSGGSCVFMLPQCGPPMSWGHAREMSRCGIAFGSHGMTHRMLSLLSEQDIEWEIGESKKAIEDQLSIQVSEFSYPYGWFNSFTPATDAALRRAGFTAVCTGIAGHNFSAVDVLRLKRLRVSWLDDSPREIRKQCLGCYNWYSVYQRCLS